MAEIKVIQIGLGTIGKVVTRSLVAKRGLQIVGAVDVDKRKVGLDLGEVAELGTRLGVFVTDDASSLLARAQADIAIHAASTRLDEAYGQIVGAIEQGVNVISACEELGNAYAGRPDLAGQLDQIARVNGVTVLGTGLSPGFTSDYLILALTGACSRVDSIKYTRYADTSAYLGGVVGEHFGLGMSAEDFREGVAEGRVIGHIGFVESIKTVADCLGWHLDAITRSVEPIHDDGGCFVSTRTLARGTEGAKVRIEMEHRAFVGSGMAAFDRIVVDGAPPIDVTIEPNIESTQATANAMVNAIPHVINAKPGLMTVADLPLVYCSFNDVRLLLQTRLAPRQ